MSTLRSAKYKNACAVKNLKVAGKLRQLARQHQLLRRIVYAKIEPRKISVRDLFVIHPNALVRLLEMR